MDDFKCEVCRHGVASRVWVRDRVRMRRGESRPGGPRIPRPAKPGDRDTIEVAVHQWRWLCEKHQPPTRIVKTPNVCGGAARIEGTRLYVWGLEEYRRLGWSDVDILDGYEQLTSESLAAAWRYADANKEEMDAAIRENDEAGNDPEIVAKSREWWRKLLSRRESAQHSPDQRVP